MSIFLGAVQSNKNAIQKRVDEVNEMIRFANENDIEVVDSTTTWQAPMRYNLLKYTKGVLYVSYQELDLYKYNRGKGKSYKKESFKVGRNDTDYGFNENEGIKKVLSNIAKMYRKAIK